MTISCKFDEKYLCRSMFVGMDLHKNYLQIAMMNEKGKVLENSRINNNLKQVAYKDAIFQNKYSSK